MVLKLLCLVCCTAVVLAGGLAYQQASSANGEPISVAADDNDAFSAAAAPLKWEVSVPSPDKQSMLQRFVDECIAVSKGTLKVPRSKSDSQLPTPIVIQSEYRICRFETTQELYQLVMGVNPSRWTGPRNSVEQVSYFDVLQFCKKLTALLRSANLIEEDQEVRLPTGAEWEYACRAKATTKYCFGDAGASASGISLVDEYAWHSGNAAGNDPSVGKLKPNRWMLADVHGYLWEFTQATSEELKGEAFPVRVWGGSWRASPMECGCSSIRQVSSTAKAPDLGFRCVISVKKSE